MPPGTASGQPQIVALPILKDTAGAPVGKSPRIGRAETPRKPGSPETVLTGSVADGEVRESVANQSRIRSRPMQEGSNAAQTPVTARAIPAWVHRP